MNAENQNKDQEVNYVAHPMMLLHETSPDVFRGGTMNKDFFYYMFQIKALLAKRNEYNNLSGVSDPLIEDAVKILEMFMNQTTLELMQENLIQKWTKEQWEIEFNVLLENIKKAYAAAQTEKEDQKEAPTTTLLGVEPVEPQPTEEKTPKIYMSKDEL